MSGVQTVRTLDLRAAEQVPAWRARNQNRHALAGMVDGDHLRLRVDRHSLVTDVLGLIPLGVRVQIEADDAVTSAAWLSALGATA